MEYDTSNKNIDPTVKHRVNSILQENNVRGMQNSGRMIQRKPYSNGFTEVVKKESHKYSSHNKFNSAPSDHLMSKKMGDSGKLSFNGEYGLSNGNEIGHKHYNGYMETVPEIKVHSHLSEQNSERIDESVMNQSNYRVNIHDTFGNPKKYNLIFRQEKFNSMLNQNQMIPSTQNMTHHSITKKTHLETKVNGMNGNEMKQSSEFFQDNANDLIQSKNFGNV